MTTIKDWLDTLPESICPYALRAILKTLSIDDDFTHLSVLPGVFEKIDELLPTVKHLHFRYAGYWKSWQEQITHLLHSLEKVLEPADYEKAFLVFHCCEIFGDVSSASPSEEMVGLPGDQPQGMKAPVAL